MRPRMISVKPDELLGGFGRSRHVAEIGAVVSTVGRWRRYVMYPLIVRAAPALFSRVLLVPSYAAAAENEDMAVLRRMLGELKAENRKLSQRLSALEGAPVRHTKPAAEHE